VNRRKISVAGGAALTALLATSLPGSAAAVPAADAGSEQSRAAAPTKSDDRSNPLESERRDLRKQAIEQVIAGEAKVQKRGGSQAVKVAPGQWVEYGVEKDDQLLSFLVEFGDQTTDTRPQSPKAPYDAPAGPAAGEIPEPDRSTDNSTYWKDTFDRQHYLDMFFNGMSDQNGESFKKLYQEMSSGRYTVDGDVSDWVKVPFHEARYGEGETHADMTYFIDDTAESWYDAQVAAGKTDAEIAEYLKTFDQWDRYDGDGDGNFDEPDGYIDHFQAIHAGEGEEAGAASGTIWSHRWAVNQNGFHADGIGPSGHAKFGGVEIGDTDLWIRDYTTEPENGGLGVFAHEYAHDLGIPDFYDTGGGENGTGFWTLMSSGSWLSHGDGAIGTTPNHMGPWEKLQLGWLDYATVDAGQSKEVKLGPAYHATKRAQAALVKLPTGTGQVDAPVDATQGSKYFFSGTNDDKVTSVTSPEFTVPAGGMLNAQVNYDTEKSFDYTYVEVSVDGGEFEPVHTSLSDLDDPNGVNEGEGISGKSNGWKPLTADLSGYAGQQVQLRFRQTNDANTHGFGFAVDAISVGTALVEDVEDDAPDWTRDEFYVVADGTYPVEYEHYYLAENRQYMGYDRTLAEGPYNFGWAGTAPDRVEHFPYQNGMLVWYANSFFSDNNTNPGDHPGAGEALPVDANAAALKWSDGEVTRNRIQTFDATFGVGRTDPLSLHREVVGEDGSVSMTTLDVPSRKQVSTFDDTDPMRYYDEENPGGSVIVGGTGTTIKVVNSNDRQGLMTIQVN
jgi:immune inhibitor A